MAFGVSRHCLHHPLIALRRYLKQRQQLGMSALSITIGASLTREVGRREMVCSSLRLSAFKVLHCRRGGPYRNC